MDNNTFQQTRQELNTICEEILGVKGVDYTIGHQEDNKLYNFEKVADMIGSNPLSVACVYWLKHVFAICQYVQTLEEGSEPIAYRFADCRNYLDLMNAINIEYFGKGEEFGISVESDTGKDMDGQVSNGYRPVN